MSAAIVWWVAIEALGLASAPLAVVIFRNLPDRGWAFAKPFGLLTLGWLIWLPLSVIQALPFSSAWIIATGVIFLASNAALLRVKSVRDALIGLLRSSWGYALATEALFTIAYATMLWERSFTPAVADTEKFMDVAFLAAIWRAPHLPPPDPWLSGYSLNYYYFGHYLMALPAKVFNTPPAIAFNLAIGLTFALSIVAVYGVATNIWLSARRVTPSPRDFPVASLVGFTSAALTMVAGNLAGAQVWLTQARKAAAQDPALGGNLWAWWTHRDLWLTYDWWSPSRVLPNTINEFPGFSFILADLHAHVLALPYATLGIGLALNMLLARGRGMLAFGGRMWPLGLAGSAVALGGLYAINGWDLPTYLGLVILSLLLQQWSAHGQRLTRDLLLNAGTAAIILASLAFLAYTPFYLTFTSPAQGIGVVPVTGRSLPGDVWNVFTLPATLALTYLAIRVGPPLQRQALPALASVWSQQSAERIRARLLSLPASIVGATPVVLLVALTLLTNRSTTWTLFWTLVIVCVCAALLLTDLSQRSLATPRGAMMSPLLIGCAAGLILICEVIYLRDVFGGTLFRMNTVFKFYYQAWLLVGVTTGPLMAWLCGHALGAIRGSWTAVVVRREAPTPALLAAGNGGGAARRDAREETSRAGRGVQWGVVQATRAIFASAWLVGMAALLLGCMIYPTLAIAARTENLSLSHSLDGAAYMAQDSTDMGDGPAVAWLNAHVTGDKVIVEAARFDEYTHLGRVSAFTGLPALVGWGGHEEQWRYNWFQRADRGGILSERLSDVSQVYTNPNSGAVLAILRRNHVQYVYVGAAERQTYPTANLDRFSDYLQVVYRDANVTIYAVPLA
ncbi:MAG TPA: DUF2298 domain-containing protein [Ktedonobacterales bacterium]